MAVRSDGHAGGGNAGDQGGVRNTLRLSAADLARLYDEMDAGVADDHPKRAFLRAAFQMLLWRLFLRLQSKLEQSLKTTLTLG